MDPRELLQRAQLGQMTKAIRSAGSAAELRHLATGLGGADRYLSRLVERRRRRAVKEQAARARRRW